MASLLRNTMFVKTSSTIELIIGIECTKHCSKRAHSIVFVMCINHLGIFSFIGHSGFGGNGVNLWFLMSSLIAGIHYGALFIIPGKSAPQKMIVTIILKQVENSEM